MGQGSEMQVLYLRIKQQSRALAVVLGNYATVCSVCVCVAVHIKMWYLSSVRGLI